MELAALIECWERTSEHHNFSPPSTEDELVSVEQELGRKLPEPLRKLYRFSNGLSLCGGNFELYPLRAIGDGLSLVTINPFLLKAGWPIPEQVQIFGDSGSDCLFGLWIGKKSADFAEPIIEVGSIGEPGCMAFVGTGLLEFLTVQTAFYLDFEENEVIISETLGVPEFVLDLLRNTDDDEGLYALRSWVDPKLPDPAPYSYIDLLDAKALQQLLNSSTKI